MKNKQRLTKSRGFVPAVALVVGLLTVTGCNSPGGTVDPTGTATAQATATESVTPLPPPTTMAAVYKPATDQGPAENVPVPVLPAKAKEFSKEGLIAFTEYWYSTLGYAFETGDPEPMMSITGPNCAVCGAMKETVVGWHSEGRWIVGGQMTVLSADTQFSPGEDGSYRVVAFVRQNRLKFFRGDKSLDEDRPQKPTVGDDFVAVHEAGHWSLVNVQRLEGS